jgi:alpha-glucosidase (family GH31 glycosyl hydrolase)
MKLNSLGFQLHEGKFGFDFRSFRNKQTYITTNDCAFVMMDKYFQMDMVLPSRRIYGLGERNRNFTLDEGTYTMWARHEPVTQVDDGTTGEGNSNGVHPFVLVQTETKGEFLGLFFRNSDLMSPIVRYTANNTATLSIISIGGNVEIYFLFKGNARNIIAQYQNLVGKPAMPPAWALGW